MKKPAPAESKAAIDSFLPQEASPLVILDRSPLESWATCPFQAAAVYRDGKVKVENKLLCAGNEVHEALSRTILEWVESDGMIAPRELSDNLERELRESRPDVQPETLDGCRRSIYEWGQFVGRISPLNILGFDGGEVVGRSGQLSLDFPAAGVRVTSELDLLYAGPSPDLLHEVDYKSGWKLHTAADVADSFQFQLHAVLVFAVYKEIKALEVVVWNTRTNNRTFRVVFERKNEPEYRSRVQMAISTWYEHHAAPVPPTWPSFEKCVLCDAAAICPAADGTIRDCATDPVGALNQYVVAEARVDALHKVLQGHVDRTGLDIVGDGCAFGRASPSERRKPAKIYSIKE